MSSEQIQGKYFLKLLARLIWAIVFISGIAFCFEIIGEFLGDLQYRPAVPPSDWPFFLFMMALAAFIALFGLLHIVKQRAEDPVIDNYLLYCLLGGLLVWSVGMCCTGLWR
jgi:hypothetical protein